MKRFASLLLLLALLGALALPAAADVAYMPRDSFIEKHWQDCSYENRHYWTNGEAGYVLAHKTPDSAEATPLPNGGIYYISNVYKGRWGVLEYDPDTLENRLWNDSVSGWVDMLEMVADYDNVSFMADHASELSDGSEELEFTASQNVACYKYPGSGVVTETLEGAHVRGTLDFSTLFTDPAGRKWGYCGYYYGHRNLWVCLDDPFNAALEPDENCVTIVTRPAAPPAETAAPAQTPAPDPAQTQTPAGAGKTVELTPAADEQTLQQAAKDNRGAGPYLLAGGGGVVIIAAAVLIAAMRKKRK